MASTNAAKPYRTPKRIVIASWIDRPNAVTNTNTRIVVSDLNGATFYSDGTNWRPEGGHQRIFTSRPNFSSTGTNAEIAVNTATIPEGLLYPGAELMIGMTGTKTGTIGIMTYRARYNGAAGTVIAWAGSSSTSMVGSPGISRVTATPLGTGTLTLTQPAGAAQSMATSATIYTVSHTIENQVTINFTAQASSTSDTIRVLANTIDICG